MLERTAAQSRLRPQPSDPAAPDLAIGWERFEDIIEEALPLLKRHYAELRLNEPFDPDWRTLFHMAGQGRLRIVAVRDRGRLVGYSGGWLVNYLASQNAKVVMINALYLEDAYRGSLKLFRQLILPHVLWAKEAGAFKLEMANQGVHRHGINRALKRWGWEPSPDEAWILKV